MPGREDIVERMDTMSKRIILGLEQKTSAIATGGWWLATRK